MPRSRVTYTPRGADGVEVSLRTDRGWRVVAEGDVTGDMPSLSGDPRLVENLVVTTNLWAHACQEKERRRTRNAPLRVELEKQALLHRELACEVADLVDDLTDEERDGWCSACFRRLIHRRVRGAASALAAPVYLCSGCGAATFVCAGPACTNMAVRSFGRFIIPRFCAEHRHDVGDFDRMDMRLDDLTDYERLFEFDKPNLARLSKLASSAVSPPQE